MTDNERDEKVDQLLHDAEHAESGGEMAARMNDEAAVNRLYAKWEGLIAEANKIDPEHKAPAWGGLE